MPGASLAAAIVFYDSDGDQLSGYGAYGFDTAQELLRNVRANKHFFTQPFYGTLQRDGTIQFNGGYGQSPSAVSSLSWTLKRVAGDRLEGMLRVRRSFYREPGATVFTGTVVLQRAK